MVLIIAAYCQIGYAQSSAVPSKEVQVKTAVLAAPEGLREKALVYGYSEKGEFVVLREGSNEMVCIADDPTQAGLKCFLLPQRSGAIYGTRSRSEKGRKEF